MLILYPDGVCYLEVWSLVIDKMMQVTYVLLSSPTTDCLKGGGERDQVCIYWSHLHINGDPKQKELVIIATKVETSIVYKTSKGVCVDCPEIIESKLEHHIQERRNDHWHADNSTMCWEV